MFALIDCNNFYVSCERLFRPDLRHHPVIVLSSNDGCVISRSNEAKSLGIKMGEPYFQVKALCEERNVKVFSSNFPLYGDLSARVMSIIRTHWKSTEVYSIDEAFLNLNLLPPDEHYEFCMQLHQKILKWTGIPTSIGVGATKTLAKASHHIGKKTLNIPIFDIKNKLEWLKQIPVGDVWGIGRQNQQQLETQGIYNAYDLAHVDLKKYQRRWPVMLLRTVMELQGIICMRSVKKQQQSILSSKSFEHMQTDVQALALALSQHCARACEKLRESHLKAQRLTVFIRTNRHRNDLPSYHNSVTLTLPQPTDDIRILTQEAKRGLKAIFKWGFHYKKVGLVLESLIAKELNLQYDLLESIEDYPVENTEAFMSVIECVNKKFGRRILRLAAEGHAKASLSRSEMRSPCYTTQWRDLPKIRTG